MLKIFSNRSTHAFFLTSVFLVWPYLVFAAPETIKGFIEKLVDLIGVAIPLLIGIAIVVFLWGIANSILHAGNEAAREKGKKLMFYGVITIFVMVSVWGIVGILKNTFF